MHEGAELLFPSLKYPESHWSQSSPVYPWIQEHFPVETLHSLLIVPSV